MIARIATLLFLLLNTVPLFSQIIDVIDNKGTIKSIDNSKWTLSGNDIFNKNTGNVGIGTMIPTSKLQVEGDLRVLNGFLDSSGDIGVAGQILTTTGVGTDWISSSSLVWSLDGNSSTDPNLNFLGTTDAQDLVFRTNNTEKARILSNGNVNIDAGTLFVDVTNDRIGIGTTTPSEILSLNGNANRVINVERNLFSGGPGRNLSIIAGGASTIGNNNKGGNLILSSGISTGDESSRIMFRTATAGLPGNVDNTPTTKMTILDNGNVGIGTNSPSSKLQVEGDLRVSGGFLDSSGDIGTAGQVFSSTGTLTDWVASNTFSWGVTGNASTNPSLNFLGTTDAQDLVFRTNNTEKARILSNGNIGIGVTPTQKLEVAGSIYLNAENSAFVVDAVGASRLGIVKRSGSGPFIAAGNNFPIIFSHLTTPSSQSILGNIGGTYTERMRINGNGNVGIGGAIPQNILHLSGITNFPAGNLLRYMQVTNFNTGNTANDGTIFGINAAGNAEINNREALPIVFSTTNAERMRIDASGNVGIGIAVPTSLLHVQGNTYLQGNLNVTGGILDSSGDIGAIGDVLSSTATGTDWISLAAASSLDWSRLGNDSTDSTINFLGTTDAQDLVFRSNNIEKMRLFSLLTNPYIGIGRTSLAGVNGGASTYTGPTLFFGDMGNISSSTGFDFIIDDDNNATNTRFTFKTNGDGAAGTIELMEIGENGNVGIGTTSAPTQKLEVIGSVYVNSEGSAIVNDVGQSRLGFAKKSGSLPVIASGSATPILLGTWSTTNLLGNIGSGNFTERLRVASNGDVGIGIATGTGTGGPDPTAKLDVNGDTIRLRTPKTPASSTAACNTGEIVWDVDYIYVCIAANSWKRSALSNF